MSIALLMSEFQDLMINPEIVQKSSTRIGKGGMGTVWLGHYLGEFKLFEQFWIFFLGL